MEKRKRFLMGLLVGPGCLESEHLNWAGAPRGFAIPHYFAVGWDNLTQLLKTT